MVGAGDGFLVGAGAGRIERPQRQRRLTARATAPVARLVYDDCQQPRAERRALAKAWQCLPRLHESLLRRILGVGGRTRDEICRPERDLLVFPH